jgi:hypothetical protein
MQPVRQKFPERRLWYTASPQDVSIDVCCTLEWRETLQVRWPFRDNEPLRDTKPGIFHKCNITVAPWHCSQGFDQIVTILTFLRATMAMVRSALHL